MTELVRTRDGSKVHRSSCRYNVANTVAWNWAEGRSYSHVVYACELYGIKLCKVCKPLAGPAWMSVGAAQLLTRGQAVTALIQDEVMR